MCSVPVERDDAGFERLQAFAAAIAASDGPKEAKASARAAFDGYQATWKRGGDPDLPLAEVSQPARQVNPVERFWAWLRIRLRDMDMADLQARRKPIQRFALKARVRASLRTQGAQRVARRMFLSLRDTCAEAKRKRGAASGN